MKRDIIGDTEDRITEAAVESSSAKYVSPGSILMVMRSGILRHTFPVAVTDRTVTLNQDLRALTPHVGVNPSFIARYLKLATKRVLEDCSKDGTTVNSIEVSALERLPLPLAPLAEQNRVVEHLDILLAEIGEGEAALEEARKGLETFRRALLKAAVTGELTRDWRETNKPNETGHELLALIKAERGANSTTGRGKRAAASVPLDTSDLPELPEGWAWARVDDVAHVGTGATPSRRELTYWKNGNIPWFTSAATNAEFALAPSEWITTRAVAETNCNVLPVGTLLVAMYGEGKTRGQITELRVEAACNQACAALIIPNPLMREWLKCWFKSFYIQLRTQAAGGVQPNLNLEIIKRLTLPIPPLAEAAEILRRVSDASELHADTSGVLKAQAADAARLRQSVLKAAFEGKLVPQDPADEPASVLLSRLKAQESANPKQIKRRKKV